MSKVITSASKKWPGTITIFDHLVLSQVELIESALLDQPPVDGEGKVRFTDIDKPRLVALLASVEKWDLQNFPNPVTVDNFPFTPRKQAHDLIMQIFSEITIVYNGEMEVPNE